MGEYGVLAEYLPGFLLINSKIINQIFYDGHETDLVFRLAGLTKLIILAKLEIRL